MGQPQWGAPTAAPADSVAVASGPSAQSPSFAAGPCDLSLGTPPLLPLSQDIVLGVHGFSLTLPALPVPGSCPLCSRCFPSSCFPSVLAALRPRGVKQGDFLVGIHGAQEPTGPAAEPEPRTSVAAPFCLPQPWPLPLLPLSVCSLCQAPHVAPRDQHAGAGGGVPTSAGETEACGGRPL